MSFSAIVKNELCRMDMHRSCCLLSEFTAIVAVNGVLKKAGIHDFSFKIVTENAAFARRSYSLIKKLLDVYPQVSIRKSKKLKKHMSYSLVAVASDDMAGVLEKISLVNELAKGKQEVKIEGLESLLKNECCRKAFLRGTFLAGGSISDPEKTYHLEITCHSSVLAAEFKRLMRGFGLNARVIKRKSNYVVYLKEGENIVDFLNVIGAHNALLELENIRILKGMRNDVNRIVNCETANLEKTVNASLRQIDNIKYIRDHIGFERLPDNLRETARLRLLHSEASLKELGEMLTPPLGKSGINHRLRKLDEIAENARGLKGG